MVGAGHVGATTAQRVLEGELADVHLVDIKEGLAAGKALDLAQAGPVVGHSGRITGSTSYEEGAGAELAIVTAGLPRKPGMSRDDLIGANGPIMASIARAVAQVAPGAVVIVVSNPLDVTTTIFQEECGFPPERVMGMAGVLDTARFRTFVAAALGCSPEDVSAMVLGGHGDSMVPLTASATVSGLPLTELLPADQLAQLVERTQNGGAEIVSLLKEGSAFYAPAAATVQMACAILRDEQRVLPACAWLTGQYGLSDLYLGVPVRLGRAGVEEIIEVAVSATELRRLQASAAAVREQVARWHEMRGGQAATTERA